MTEREKFKILIQMAEKKNGRRLSSWWSLANNVCLICEEHFDAADILESWKAHRKQHLKLASFL